MPTQPSPILVTTQSWGQLAHKCFVSAFETCRVQPGISLSANLPASLVAFCSASFFSLTSMHAPMSAVSMTHSDQYKPEQQSMTNNIRQGSFTKHLCYCWANSAYSTAAGHVQSPKFPTTVFTRCSYVGVDSDAIARVVVKQTGQCRRNCAQRYKHPAGCVHQGKMNRTIDSRAGSSRMFNWIGE